LIFTIALAARVLRDYAPAADAILPDVAANAVTSSQVTSKPKMTAAAKPKAPQEKVSPQPPPVVNYVHENRAVASATPKSKTLNEAPRMLPVRLPRQQTETPTRTKAPTAVKPRQQVVTRVDDSPQVLRAPDGTEVVKFKDGRIRVSGVRDHGGQRQ
jgi:hypothetical protein